MNEEETDWRSLREAAVQLIELDLEERDLQLFLDLGRWAETARLASLLEDDRYFDRRGWRRGLDRLRQVELSERLAASVKKMSGLPEGEHQSRLELLRPIFKELGG